MSVEKVNKYKEQKANRREILAREKKTARRNRIIAMAVAAVVVLGIVGAIGVTIRNQYVIYQNTRPNYDVTNMVVADLAGVLDAAEEEAGGDEAAPENEPDQGSDAGAES